ncbi:hypothetical protein L1887_62420 [Cichorium endivia]|nr:hypothetical protein L1887_62420 [Cichorium endivia]
MFSSSGIVHTHQAGKDGRMLAADGNLDPGLRMLKHLRRGLPSFVVAQIEALLRSHPDELPPANLLARPAIKPVHRRHQSCQAITLCHPWHRGALPKRLEHGNTAACTFPPLNVR